jgi:hypothetical protein
MTNLVEVQQLHVRLSAFRYTHLARIDLATFSTLREATSCAEIAAALKMKMKIKRKMKMKIPGHACRRKGVEIPWAAPGGFQVG